MGSETPFFSSKFKLEHKPVALSDEKLDDIEQRALDVLCGSGNFSISDLATCNISWTEATNDIHELLQHISYLRRQKITEPEIESMRGESLAMGPSKPFPWLATFAGIGWGTVVVLLTRPWWG